jgi:hypothetical protein
MLLVTLLFLHHGGGTLWLFLNDIFHQVLFYFGTVAAMSIFLWEKRTGRPVQWKWISAFFLFCLFVSCFQAWIDEHNNSDRLIQDKLTLSEQVGFWKAQSYSKDAAIISRDSLLFENLKTLGSTQQTENKTQQSLTDLSGKIFDLTKPEVIRIANRVMAVEKAPNAAPNSPNIAILIAETNRRIGAFSGKIVCQSAFVTQQVSMLQGMMSQGPAYKQQQGQTTLDLDFNGSAWDVQQPIVAIIVGENLDVNKCSITQR